MGQLPVPPNTGPSSVPQSLTGFVGRARDLALLGDLLRQEGVRLLTLTGPGGIGKTRLAQEVARGLGASFPDGIAFVSLVATNDPERVPSIVAQALALDPRADRTAADAVRDAIGNRGMLLVLDNLEHVLPSAIFLAELLGACPHLTILATSRTRLDLTGEHVYVLEPLAADEARTLFLQRAGAYNAGHPQADDRPTIDAICGRLDRIPLAIELAAARTATFSPVALLDRLGDPLTVLRHGPRDVPLRHQTMRDTIAWSYALLDEEQKAGFRRLAVFVGGFTLEGAQAVLGDGVDALDLVEFLAARSLVVPMRGESTQLRCTMLESIRQFGMDALAATGEDETVRAVHADWLIAMAEHAIPFYDGPQLMAYARTVRNEMDNIRAALDWSFQRRDGVRANRLAGSVWRLWQSGEARWLATATWNERILEGKVGLERALALREGVPSRFLIESLAGMVFSSVIFHETSAIRTYSLDLLTVSIEYADMLGAHWAHMGLSDAAIEERDMETARAEILAALAAAHRSRDADNQLCGAHAKLGRLELDLGNLAAAETSFRASLDHGERCGNPNNLALATHFLAVAYLRRDKRDEAVRTAVQCLDHLADQDDVARTQGPALTIAQVALHLGSVSEAVMLLGYAATIPGFYGSINVWDQDITKACRDATTEQAFARAWAEGTQLAPRDVRRIGEQLLITLEKAEEAQPAHPPSLLSPREDEVLRLLVAGKTNRAIGNDLFISERTVERHVLHLMTKLDRDSRTALVAWAVRNGFDA